MNSAFIFLLSLIVSPHTAFATPFTVDGSTLYVTGGSVGISTNAPIGLFTVGAGTMVVTTAGKSKNF